MSDAEAEEAPVRILVVDDRVFQRRLITETVRCAGRCDVDHAESVEHALMMFSFFEPEIMITDWDLEGDKGLELVRRLRAGEAGAQYRATPVILVAARSKESEVNRARNAGVDEFVMRPFSTNAIVRRVQDLRTNKREFIESPNYVGPCRRRKRANADYDGPRRRLFDSQDKNADAPDIQIRKGMARMYCESISAKMKVLTPDTARDLSLTCGQLSALAEDMEDRLLMSACSSLFNYVKGVGAEGTLNRDVVQAHLDSIVQLAELPNYQIELRQTVTQQLSVMVTKKLRQAGQAA